MRLASADVPLPPERPFDLGTIPHAATPVAVVSAAAVLPPARPQLAGLYYAPAPTAGKFGSGQTFASLDRAAFADLLKR